MDVHRSRFVPFPTSAISALAFSRSSDAGYKTRLPALRLAIGRANGNIEIWNPLRGIWAQESILHGENRSIDGLAWTQESDEASADGQVTIGRQRLFSIASSPAVVEWDLIKGTPKRKSSGNFSEVWCFAAQPRGLQHKDDGGATRSQDIIAGCGDGTLVLLSTADDDLQFKKLLARVSGKRARCMCVTYQTRDVIVAGFADSIIRIFDTRNGSLLRTMSFGVGIPGAPKNVLVWQVACLPNGDIVSGDSSGEVRFWDGRNYSLLQRLSGHDSDCLDLALSSDGKTVLSGSIDGKMAVFRQSSADGKRRHWARMAQRRVHNGEVKALAAFDSKFMSVVVSGGSDVSPMVTPLREYGKENLRALPSLPQDAPVASASKARLLISWWEKTICVWHIAPLKLSPSAAETETARKLVAKITLDTNLDICHATISTDGRLLVASTSKEIKAFQLKRRPDTLTLSIRKIPMPPSFSSLGARLLSLSPNGKWLAAVTPDSEVRMARFAPETDRPKYLHCIPKTVELDRRERPQIHQTGLGGYDRTITRLPFASDSSVLVAGDLCGQLDSWMLQGHEDPTAPACDVATEHSRDDPSMAGSDDHDSSSDDEDDGVYVYFGQHWADNPKGHLLPKLDSAPLVLSFRPSTHPQPAVNGNPGVHSTRHNPHAHSHGLPSGQHRLWVLTARHQMYEFDVLAGRLTEWSKRNPSAVLPEDFTKIRDRAMGAVWDVRGGHERVWLYGSSWLFMLDVAGDLSEGAVVVTKKRKRKSMAAAGIDEDSGDDAAKKQRGQDSGAGSRIVGEGIGVARRYENGEWTDLPSSVPRGQEEDEDDDEEEDGLQLMQLRSGGDEQAVVKPYSDGERKWWCTFKYRPILGMVPLDDETDSHGERPLEAALVERPIDQDRS